MSLVKSWVIPMIMCGLLFAVAAVSARTGRTPPPPGGT